ncbi:hypothetical protein QBC34DRAFT_310143 [Podospora aff. communis PSN243]|uniref:LysM domain-containing protein n=1 Tax=Podospora aff. communis PSN243 TaxID=3040156 RepID=A0AAV9G5Z0_9PEZI|nr:hypothetical protein QBC34DRAFT_310143 [Podospora aff. communis PSN243]
MSSTTWLKLAIAAVVSLSARAQDSSPTGPTFPNMAANCNAFHTVVSGDGCISISALYGITLAQFYEWNPDIEDDCATNFWLGSAYCVGVGAAIISSASSSAPPLSSAASASSSVPSSVISSASSISTPPYSPLHPITEYPITTIPIETTFPPTRTQSGQPASCTNWYLPDARENCANVIAQFSGLTPEELLAWNPTLGEDCGGLYAGWWVCVGVRTSRTIDMDFTTSDITSVDVPTATEFTSQTWPTISSYVPEPTHAGTVAGCLEYAKAEADDTCLNFVDGEMLTEAQFFELNPGLEDNCEGLWANYYYCIVGPNGILNYPSPTTDVAPTPTPSGQINTCVRWFMPGLGLNCAGIAHAFGSFSEAEFISWNPSVGATCRSIRPDQWYCIGIPSTPTTRTTPLVPDIPTSTSVSPPTQTGVASNCEKWWYVGKGDTCSRITYIHDIELGDFLDMNPAIGTLTTNTCEDLERDVYVCVALSEAPSSSAVSSSVPSSITPSSAASSVASSIVPSSVASPTSSAPAITTPTPIQAGMVAGCRRFYMAQTGDGCWAISDSAGITLSDFYDWNPALNLSGECSGLWLNYYYCIGIAGPTTTISSGPPVRT